MIRLSDAIILAYTKFQTHKIRTGIAVGIAGLMFGLIIGAIIVVQGTFDSIDRFSKQSLTERTVLTVSGSMSSSTDISEVVENAKFIQKVRALHAAGVAKKTAAAKKYSINYEPLLEDPSPIVTNDGKQTIDEAVMYEDKYVLQAVKELDAEKTTTFDIHEFVKKYKSATVLGDYHAITDGGDDGRVTLMKDGREAFASQDNKSPVAKPTQVSAMLIDGGVTAPFVGSNSFDSSKGEAPVIIPFSAARDLLGIKAVDKKAPGEEKLQQLMEVRERVGEISVSFCYRNQASRQLLATVAMQKEEKARVKDQTMYQRPSVEYAFPDETSCGPVAVTRDVRTPAEKVDEANMAAYQKEIGEYIGEPVQHKVTMRGVGIVGEMDGSAMSDAAGFIQMIAGSNLGYEVWGIPSDLLNKLPEEARPGFIFDAEVSGGVRQGWYLHEYLVEFSSPSEARSLIESATGPGSQGTVFASQFGSNSLLLDDMKRWASQGLFWALIFVGGVAVIIMASMIGRTVSDGRRESAVFRAIGAKRSDVASVYGVYALMLSFRAALFAVVLGAVIAFIITIIYEQDATVGAHLAYASADPSTKFNYFSIWTIHLPIVLAVMIVAGLLASIIPIVRSARRNPINDMRDDT